MCVFFLQIVYRQDDGKSEKKGWFAGAQMSSEAKEMLQSFKDLAGMSDPTNAGWLTMSRTNRDEGKTEVMVQALCI